MEKNQPRIAIPQDAIRAFCERWGVSELALFGSVLRDDFGPESDVDVLVTFEPGRHPAYADLIEMKTELEQVFGRSVDIAQRTVVIADANWIRRSEILTSARAVYAA